MLEDLVDVSCAGDSGQHRVKTSYRRLVCAGDLG